MSTIAPVTAEFDGWTVSSKSDGGGVETPQDIIDQFKADEPTAPATPATPGATPPAQPAERKAPTPPGQQSLEDDDDEPQATDPAKADAKAETPEAKAQASADKKKSVPLTERIAQVKKQLDTEVWRRNRAKEEADREEARLVKLRAERDAIERGDKPAAKAPAGDQAQAAKAGKGKDAEAAQPQLPPKPKWAEFDEKGKSWDEYQDALETWFDQKAEAKANEAARRVEERVAERERKAQEANAQRERSAEHERWRNDYNARLEKTVAAHPDWDQTVAAVAKLPKGEKYGDPGFFLTDLIKLHDNGPELLYQLGKQPELSKSLSELLDHGTYGMMRAFRMMSDPSALLFHFAQNPEEFARLATLENARPDDAMLALGALVTRFEGAQTGPPTKSSSVPVARTPIRPVGGSRSAGASSARDEDEDQLSDDEWFRKAGVL